MLAWISVHDHVVGGKLRELSKNIGCSQKESLGILVSLWLWGINNADRTGELKSCNRNDVSEILSIGLSENLNPKDIVAGLIEQNWIDEVDDGTLYLHDWDVWQAQWYKFLSTKEYDAKRKREAFAKRKEENKKDTDLKEDNVNIYPMENHTDKQQDIPSEKPKRASKKKNEKKQYEKYVSLTEPEYEELANRFGQKATDRFIEELNLYKGSSGKTYKSDYMAILSWVVEKIEKKYPGLIQRPAPSQSGELLSECNPFAKWKEDSQC